MKINFKKAFTKILGIIVFTLFTFSVNAQTKTYKRVTKKIENKESKQKKKLVYLYTSNGGMVGYYSDGSVVGCPRCEFLESNLLRMLKEKPTGKWNLKKPNDFISYEEDNGWVLINYVWKEKAL
jgi:hypothetical protein